jgi:hypothetical protein
MPAIFSHGHFYDARGFSLPNQSDPFGSDMIRLRRRIGGPAGCSNEKRDGKKIEYPLLALVPAMKDIGDGCHQIGLNVTLVIPLLPFLLHFLDCSPLRLNGHPPSPVEWLPQPLKQRELLEPAFYEFVSH